ncbi:MAG: hypothetical protein ACLFQ6_07800, partial [Candidatus Sumerlaeia bacterium]
QGRGGEPLQSIGRHGGCVTWRPKTRQHLGVRMGWHFWCSALGILENPGKNFVSGACIGAVNRILLPRLHKNNLQKRVL